MDNSYFNSGQYLIEPTKSFSGGFFNLLTLPTQQHNCELLNYINSITDEDGFARKSNFSPMALKRNLTSIYLLKSVDDGEDFLITVFGSLAVDIIGKDYTNKLVSDIPDTKWRVPLLQKILNDKKMLVTHHCMGDPKAVHYLIESLYIPLKDQDGAISHILVGFQLLDGKLDESVTLKEFTKILHEIDAHQT